MDAPAWNAPPGERASDTVEEFPDTCRECGVLIEDCLCYNIDCPSCNCRVALLSPDNNRIRCPKCNGKWRLEEE